MYMDKILHYLPLFMQKYREMQQITGAEQPLLETLENTLGQTLDNNFILTCNETGIRKFEQLLGLYPVPEDTLETRRMKVLNRWNNFVPYTWRVLTKRMELICDDNYKLTPDFNDYKLGIKVWLEGCGQADALDHLLKCVMPANILLNSKNEIPAEAETVIYAVSYVTDCEVQEMMDYYHDEYEKKGGSFIAGGTVEVTLTESSDVSGMQKQDINGTAGFGGGTVEYMEFEARG